MEGISWNTILAGILGWIGGVLSPLIHDSVKRRRRIKEFEKGLLTELVELEVRMVAVASQIALRTQSFDKDFFNWMRGILERYEGDLLSDDILRQLKSMPEFTDEHFAAIAAANPSKSGVALMVKRYDLPYLNSHLGLLSGFSADFQAKVLDIRTQLDFFNQEVESNRFLYRLTFEPGLSTENYDAACEAQETSHRQLMKAARHITDRVEKLRKNVAF